MITAFLLLLSLIPDNSWVQKGNISDYRNVWLDWNNTNPVKWNYIMHLYLGRMRANSRLLKSTSYFASPLSVRTTLTQISGIGFENVPRMQAKIDANRIYHPQDFDYGDSRTSLEIVKIPEVHKKGYVGIGVKIALLDVGVDSTHPAVSHIWRRHGVIAKHDFNSGDHLFLQGLESEIPLIRHGLVQYINSFDVASDSSHLTIIYSVSPTDSIGQSYFYGKWTLGLTIGTLSRGRVVSWDTVHLDGYGHLRNFPALSIRNDTVFMVWQEYQGNFRVKFSSLDLNQRQAGDTITLSNPAHESVNPIVLSTDSVIFAAWVDTSAGLILRKSVDGGISFSSPETLVIFHGLPSGVDGFASGDTLVLTCGVGDSSFVFRATSTDTQTFWIPGIFPASRIENGNLLIALYDSSKVKVYEASGDTLREIFSKDVDFLYKMAFSGDTLYIVDGGLWKVTLQDSGIAELDSEFVDYISTDKNFVVYRMRGDNDITPDPYDPTEHGTKMLSIIGGFLEGSIVGGAPGADFLIAKTERVVSGPNGGEFESVIEEDFWVEAMEWSIRHGAQILSSSLGYRYTGNHDNFGDSLMTGEFAHSSRMASEAYRYNLVVVTAMGNIHHTTYPDPDTGDTSLVVPADARDVISVGGIVNADSVELDCGFGPTADGRIKPDVVAPYTISWPDTDGTVYIIGGTSISTAIVSGGIGAVLQAHPFWNAEQILNYVKETATHFQGLPDSNNLTGYGIFNALQLLEKGALQVPPPGNKDQILTLYPNPVKSGNVIRVKFLSFHTGLMRAYIYTIGGELLKQQSIGCTGIGQNEFTINLPENLAPGTYILLLRSGFSKTKAIFSVVK